MHTGDRQVLLNWTAVGDNLNFGTASSYIVKYYNGPISESNWDNASTYSQSWVPAENGTLESYSVTMPVQYKSTTRYRLGKICLNL